jgi:hypothetical protein
MTPTSFRLEPFPGTHPHGRLDITGSLTRRGRSVTLRYDLRGEPGALALPEPEHACRRQGLWEDTCLEFFLAPRQSPRYWEFNLSPAGPWNVYAFDGYRQGMREEPAFAALPGTVHREPACLRLTVEVDMALILPAAPPLDLGIAAVLKGQDGERTYWALTHPGPRPDFHRRDAFIIEL